MASTGFQEPIVARNAALPENQSDRERARRISAVIRFAEKRLRRRFPLLNAQNALGTLIFFTSAAGFVASSVLYLQGAIPACACILANALFASLLHELEHDLIHNLYFNRRPLIQNAMMFAVWAFRGNIINPWYRRRIHLLHHKESGQHTDLEEQLIGNGMKYGLMRLLTTFDGFSSTLLRKDLHGIPEFRTNRLAVASFPFVFLFALLTYAWLIVGALNGTATIAGAEFPWPAWIAAAIPALNAIAVIYLLPNILRQASINLVSSSMHYFGDVDGIVDQTQVLNAWYFWPVQLFCFNFGSTHGIHHFVVSQPFYLRQMVAAPAHAAMRKYGVRFNDLGTFSRANRLSESPAERHAD